MMRRWLGATFILLVASSTVLAQAGAWQFRWHEGQVLTYRVEHVTSASETTGNGTSETTTKLHLTKRWQVLGVDRAGVATLQLSLAALRLETAVPTRDALVFDSAAPEKSDPHLREQLARFI